MPASITEMNMALYNASLHILEAGKHLSNIQEFMPEAGRLFKMSQEMAAIIQPEVSKVTNEQMSDILDEIFSLDEANTTEKK